MSIFPLFQHSIAPFKGGDIYVTVRCIVCYYRSRDFRFLAGCFHGVPKRLVAKTHCQMDSVLCPNFVHYDCPS